METSYGVDRCPRLQHTFMILHVVITPFFTYPSTKSTWFAFDLAMGGLDPHEQREAEEAAMVGNSPPG